jgi:drug/metabolite transporter (DMT)-like permease
MKTLSVLLFGLNPILWGSFYAAGKFSLGFADPFVFSTAELAVAAVPALVILAATWRRLNFQVVRRGVVLGMVLYAGVLTSTWALAYTTATDTAFYPAINGFVAALIAWLIFRRPVGWVTWSAGLLSVLGAMLLISQVTKGGGHLLGDGIGLAAAVIYTIYIFCADKLSSGDQRSLLPMFATEVVTMAVLSAVATGVSGHARGLTAAGFGSVWPWIVYAGLATTFLPTAISIFFQRYINPVTVAFLYVLEPVWGALIAHLGLGETLTIGGYLGGALIVSGAVLNTWLQEPEAGSEPVRDAGRAIGGAILGVGLLVGSIGRLAQARVEYMADRARRLRLPATSRPLAGMSRQQPTLSSGAVSRALSRT